MAKENRIEEVKNIIKQWMEIYGELSAPTQWAMEEVLEEENITCEEFNIAIDEIGEELEKQGYKLIWNNCKECDAGCQRFVIVE